MLSDQLSARAGRHSDDQWKSIRSRIKELYQHENRPLAEVRQIRKDELNFDATWVMFSLLSFPGSVQKESSSLPIW